ncbi:hypothetical protein BTM25_36690 [Actinomadura rubteroloni]|uniref:Lipoprotein n=1 Tax=Actinomadura rubteroloni TaxID=1926885 RepID=A0A2P4UJ38_9ACTN|nr:hypothetical protein [Actinomadura rubteroloni]POM25028.1 hypothetical protein BTM25_36690 [Actinomadura rubteroloni]
MAMHVRPVRSTPDGGPRPRRRARTAAAALLPLTLTASACGSTHPSAGTFSPTGRTAAATPLNTPTTTSEDPATLPPAQIDKIVLARYRAYQSAYQHAYETNDPTALPTVAMDPVLSRVTTDIERTKAKNEIWRFTNISNPRIYARSKDGHTVYVVDCISTLGAYRFSTLTGKRIDGGPGTAFLYRSAVSFGEGTWKVSDSAKDKRC